MVEAVELTMLKFNLHKVMEQVELNYQYKNQYDSRRRVITHNETHSSESLSASPEYKSTLSSPISSVVLDLGEEPTKVGRM